MNTKRTNLGRWWGILLLALGASISRADNPCVENPVTNALYCLQQGALAPGYALSQTNYFVGVGQSIIPPTASNLTMSNGLEVCFVTWICSTNPNPYITNTVSYTLSNPYLVPAIPGVFWVPGTYTYTYQAIANGGPCIFTNTLATVTVTVVTNNPDVLLDVDFSKGTSSAKVGYAAIGDSSGDFWNSYAATGHVAGVLANLKTAEGNVSPIGILVTNLPTASTNGSPDAMYNDYFYTNSSTATLTITNLSTGVWNVYLYADDGKFTLSVGGNSYGTLTNYDGSPSSTSWLWQQGVQYVVFQNVVVTNGQPMTITVNSGQNGAAMISGLQIASATHYPNPEPFLSGLASWWPAEGNAVDIIGGNNGTLQNGAGFTNGMVGQSFNLNGTNQCVTIPYSPSLVSSNFSVEAWIKPGTQPESQTLIYGQSLGHCQLVARQATNGTQIAFQFGVSSSTYYDVVSTNVMPVGQFSHVVGTWDGTTLRLYINGVLNNQRAPGAYTAWDSGCPFYIGSFYEPGSGSCHAVGQSFKGQLDEVSAYNRAITSDEAAALYNAGSAGKYLNSNSDSDYDGVSDVQELADRTDPHNPNSVLQSRLGYWRFDNTNTWVGDGGQLPLMATNVIGVPSWDTNAVLIDSAHPAILKYRDVETNGNANINLRNGTMRLWFKPDWSSVNQGGTGPGGYGRLIEMGNNNPVFNSTSWVIYSTNGWWSLYFNTNGNQLVFGSSTNGYSTVNLSADISWVSNRWHQIVLTYTPTNSLLYLDGQLNTNGTGSLYFPNVIERTNGFRIGSDASGTNQAQGIFDELETFNYPLTATNAADSDQNGLPDWWEFKYFGHLAVDPYADYDCDGTNNLQEYLNGTDPNKISFSVSFPNQFVSTNIISGTFSILCGVPGFYAVLVDSTNFTGATWIAYSSSNITVDISAYQGAHDVWIGLRGVPSDAHQTWEEATFVLDSIPPTISITNPVNNATFNASRVNVGGNFTASSLKQITVNGVQAFIDGTNYEVLNIPLSGGTNIITAIVENMSGATNVASIIIIGTTNSDGSLNNPVQLQAAPVAGFAPLQVTFSVQTNMPGMIQQVLYDFNGDAITDFVTNNLDPFTYTYSTNGEYFPIVTILTDVGRFSSVGGWNAVSLDPSNQPVRISVQGSIEVISTISITDPVDIKWVSPSNLYVLSGSTATVTELSTNGSTIRSLSGIGDSPSGLDVDSAGNVYVAMTGDNQIWKFIPTISSFIADTNFGNGGYIGMFDGDAGGDVGQFKAPFDVVVAPDGQTFTVSDSGNNRIQQFAVTNGMFIASAGSQGSDFGQFNTPKGLAYDSAGILYIVDSGNSRIAMTQGSTVIGMTGTNGTDLAQFSSPVNISVSQQGVYVADTGNNRIQKFDLSEHGLFSITPSTVRFAFSTNFSQPYAVAAINSVTNDQFYVADTGNNRVILCQVPNENADTPLTVWNNMTNRIVSGDFRGAALHFSVVSEDNYRQAFLSAGTSATISAINQIGKLTLDYISGSEAEYYFTETNGGQIITFPVRFVKENGLWKIVEF